MRGKNWCLYFHISRRRLCRHLSMIQDRTSSSACELESLGSCRPERRARMSPSSVIHYHSDATAAEIVFHTRPVILDADGHRRTAYAECGGFLVLARVRGGERSLLIADRPVGRTVCGVVEHLPDHVAPASGVAAPLNLDQRWEGVLVKVEAIERPARTAAVTRALPSRRRRGPSGAAPSPPNWSPAKMFRITASSD